MCCGKHKVVKIVSGESVETPQVDVADHTIRPDEPCVLCGEKHLDTAFALGREGSYEIVNRAMVIGELVLAQWHIWTFDISLAKRIRDMRHLVQDRREAEVDWISAVKKMNELVNKNLEKAV